ncbi:MAG: hypothetical protein PHI41_00725 [Erysipelotrichaceae bacterium]|nr:hypothetical protein [Erysipelotrichaceae bacterium]
MLKNKRNLISLVALLLVVSVSFVMGRISQENEYQSKSLSQRAGSYQLWGGGETISASVGIDNEFWYSEPGSGGIAETFSCELEPIDDFLFLISSDQFDYNVVNLKEDYLMLIDTDTGNIMKIDKVSDTPTILFE